MIQTLRSALRAFPVQPLAIDLHERGVLIVNGRPVRLLEPGWHPVVRGLMSVIRLDISQGFTAASPELVAVSRRKGPSIVTIADDELAFVRADGQARATIGPGRWALWNDREAITLERRSLRSALVDVPVEFRGKLARSLVQTVHVPPESEGLLFVDDRFVQTLAPGVHHVNISNVRSVSVPAFSTREEELVVNPQEILSKDKVSLKFSAVIRFRRTDTRLAYEHYSDASTQLYSDAQLAMREIVADLTLDQLLESRRGIAEELRGNLAARTHGRGIEITHAALRDVVVPASIRTVLHRVLEADRQAQANLIQRREETAATRALANTARLLESNPTLARLKELEAWKDIASRVGTINLVTHPNHLVGTMLSQSAAPAPTAPPAVDPEGAITTAP